MWFESWLRQLLSSPDVLHVISAEVVSSVADIEDYLFLSHCCPLGLCSHELGENGGKNNYPLGHELMLVTAWSALFFFLVSDTTCLFCSIHAWCVCVCGVCVCV